MEGSLSGNDCRSKIESILKTLEDELINASITESMLQTLEELEHHLLHSSSSSSSNPITTSMKAAYCAIAVHCTLNHPHFKTSNPTHFGALKKIWKARVHDKATFLFSDEIENKKYVINTLSCIPNTRKDALHKLQLFLAQATQNLGLPQNDSHLKGKSFTTVDAENVDDTTTCGKFNSMSIHEVPKTGDSPQCSSLDLENLGIEDMNQEAQFENHSPDAYVPNSQACQTNEAILKNSSSTHQSDVHHSSLMETNCSARTHESDDSIGCLQGGTSDPPRITFPSPKKKRKLPLFIMYGPKYISKRRKTRRWSQWEVDNLMAGVKEYGPSWKKIHDNFTFDKRTQVDLKDKWRNIFGE